MATLDHASLLRAAYDAWNAKDMGRVMSYAQPDARVANVAFGSVHDLRSYDQNWMTAFPDGRVEIVNIVAHGDFVIGEFIGRGTHTGPLDSPVGKIGPAGRKVEIRMCEVWECRNGKLASCRAYFDSRTLTSQLGLAQSMGAMDAMGGMGMEMGKEARTSNPSRA
jgi:predicted ester cyclase